jgi:lysine 2,3-aminomutase
MLDIPGGHGKVPIGPGYLGATADGYDVTDPQGAVHRYPDIA